MERLLLLLFMTLLLLPAAAQPTLTRADYEWRLGQTTTTIDFEATSVAGADAVLNATGNNATYDFTLFNYAEGDSIILSYLLPPFDVPGAPSFPGANVVINANGVDSAGEDSTGWLFTRLDDDGLFALGLAGIVDLDEDGVADTTVGRFDPEWRQIVFPMTVGTTWEDSTSFIVNFLGSDVVAFSDATEGEVEGFGTLITPRGSATALRVRTTTRTTFIFGAPDTTTTINFISVEGRLSAALELDAAGNVAFASYQIEEGEGGGTAVEPVPGEVPKAFALGQNYPNPFNPATTIPFHLAQAGPVKVTVFNTLGQAVAVLADAVLPAGSYVADWQAGGFPSGVYLYRLEVDGRTVQTRPMILQK